MKVDVGEFLDFDNIQKKYPDMWVLIGDYELTEERKIKRGKVLLASYRKSDIYKDMHRFKGKVKRVAIRYTGKIPEIVGLFHGAVIKFEPERNLIVIGATVEGKEGEKADIELIFDTGASYTVISWDILEWLGYAPGLVPTEDRLRLVTGSGVEYVPRLRVLSLEIDGVKVENLDVLAHNLPEESFIDGVLGLNFMRQFYYCINHKAGEIEIKMDML